MEAATISDLRAPVPVPPLVGVTGPRLHAADIASTPAILRHAFVDAQYAHYAQAVARAGGMPVYLTRECDPAALVQRLDAIVLAGGQDVDPRLYGRQPTLAATMLDPTRDRFELALVREALERRTPLIGICRGAQLLNVALGGTLVDDLTAIQGVEHTLVLYPPDARVHDVRCEPGTRLHELYGDLVCVNSFHHQGIGDLGRGVRVTARAQDDVIEAIEVDGAPAIGVQWHPEMLGDVDPLLRWLIRQADDQQLPLLAERSTQ